MSSWSRVSLPPGPLSHYPKCHIGPAEADTCAFVPQCPKEVHDTCMTNERVFRLFALNRLQARHRVGVEYNIVRYEIHVPVFVQCLGNVCRPSSKDGAVILGCFGQLAALFC